MTKPVTIQYAFPATPYGQKEGEESGRAGAPRSFRETASLPLERPRISGFFHFTEKTIKNKNKTHDAEIE